MLRSPKTAQRVTPTAMTVVLTGGGSGGHITPLPPLGRALKKQDANCKVICIGLKGDKIELSTKDQAVFDKVYYVSSGKFRRYHGESYLSRLIDIKTLALNVRDLFKVIAGIFAAYRILKHIKPNVLFSKGGFVVVPVGVAARLLNIPIVTHDSDAVAGMANRIIGRWANIHATGMPPENYDYAQATIRYVGVPLGSNQQPTSTDLKAIRSSLNIDQDAQVLLVAGGGLGSRTINDLVCEIIPELLEMLPKLYVIHLTGNKLLESVESVYGQSLNKDKLARVKVLGFSDQIADFIAIADLVIARAGATTLAELAIAAKPSIIIPAPFLSGGHQLKNAQILADADAAVVVQEQIPPQDFLDLTKNLLSDQSKRLELSVAMSEFARPKAASDLAEVIINQAIHH